MNQCPYCDDGITSVKTEEREFNYRNEKVSIDFQFYFCDKCGNGYTTNSLDDGNVRKVHLHYWKNHVDEGVLFDNVITDLDQLKTPVEYKYMLEHYYIYTLSELNLILNTLEPSLNLFPELKEAYQTVKENYGQ